MLMVYPKHFTLAKHQKDLRADMRSAALIRLITRDLCL